MKRLFNKERCVGCGICTHHCPQHLLSLDDNKCYTSRQQKCTNCRICEQVCPYTAISFDIDQTNTFPRLLKGVEIPFHNGCYQGLIEKLLAQITDDLLLQDNLVIFKSKTARFEINVEIHASDNFLSEAIAYKVKNPEKIVIVYYCDEEPEQNVQAFYDFNSLKDTQVTIFHMLNYFSELKNNLSSQECSIDFCDMLKDINNASFIARGSFTDITSIKQTEIYMKTAINNQIAGKQFSFIDMLLPCHWRIEDKPNNALSSHQIQNNIEWFHKVILKKYLLGIYKQ